MDSVNSSLATALIYHLSPKHHPEAMSIFRSILSRKPNCSSALIGIGYLLEEDEEYTEAVKFLSQALQRDQTNVYVGTEVAWCRALTGDYSKGLEELENYLPQISLDGTKSRELKARTHYRIGMCLWELDQSRSGRKSRSGAYASFLAAVKTDVNYSLAYTSLGIYYQDYAKDKTRARKCFQKAFELSASEVQAAEHLARSFADQRDWDIVEAIAQRVIDSGRTKPAPGSKRKGISWPYAALGTVQLNKQEFSQSIVSFLAALRISPNDYNSFVGLAESYFSSGRYNSALRTLRYAEGLDNAINKKNSGDRWFARHMLANVSRELGDYDDAISGYRSVLEMRPKEFGVSIALLQTCLDKAWHCIETGFFGQAIDDTVEGISVATSIAEYRPDAFNLWKAVGDACSLFTWVRSKINSFPLSQIKALLETGIDSAQYDFFSHFDGVGQKQLSSLQKESAESSIDIFSCLAAAILAQKRAILVSSDEKHAQAVAWYNLGWTEYRTHCCLKETEQAEKNAAGQKKFLKTAVRCFKRAIELEAGNAEFWNALGIVTTQLNPKVAQHSFVRSLHLNERNAKVWTNLGALGLLHNDFELAHSAFARAQSTEPDYAHAWVGEGLVALLLGDTKEAVSHFMHAFEISDCSSVLVKRQYASSAFDNLLHPHLSSNFSNLMQPLFALRQIQAQYPTDMPSAHLATMFLERVGDYEAANHELQLISAAAEAAYELTESSTALVRFAQAKAGLGRNQLAARSYEDAADSAETALDLSFEADISNMSSESLAKMRLSAHLTSGLAKYHLNAMAGAIEMFRAALEESNGATNIVCLLAQVLWATGGEDEKTVAREQLLDAVERNHDHINSILALGVIAILDHDRDGMEAVRDGLHPLRMDPNLDTKKQLRIEKVLNTIAVILLDDTGVGNQAMAEVMTAIMLSPSKPHGWSQLAALTDEEFPATMALKTAVRAVLPNGPLDAEDLAKAFGGAGTAANGQRGIMLAPWIEDGWNSFANALVVQ